MSLVGRLEDLSPADIVQIVYLSRRSGRLELQSDQQFHSISFSHGRIAAASSGDNPDLGTWLLAREVLSAAQLHEARQVEAAAGIDLGTVILDMNLVAGSALIALIEQRIGEILDRIRELDHGEFNFVLSEGLVPREIGYDLVALTGAEGYEPQKFLGAGEKIRPLQGLEESVRAGKAFLRGSRGPAAGTPSLEERPSERPSDRAFDPDSTRPVSPPTRFSVRGEPVAGGSRVAMLVYEADPVLRVAIRRALSDEGLEILQTGSLDEARAEIDRLLAEKRFFITIADTAGHGADGSPLIALVKRANPGLPVATLSLPGRVSGTSRMQPDEVIELASGSSTEVATTVDHAVEMASAFAREERDRWLMMIAAEGSEEEATRRFYDQGTSSLASRRLELIELLLVAISDPEDILSLASTLLRAAAEYVDRGAIFVETDGEFLGLAGFGADGADGGVNESIKGVRIPADEESVLRDVAEAGQAHRGKLKKTRANVELVQRLGSAVPSEVVVLPIAKGDTVIGVLYGDNGGNRAPISETSGLEVLLGQAGRALQQGLEARKRRARSGGGG